MFNGAEGQGSQNQTKETLNVTVRQTGTQKHDSETENEKPEAGDLIEIFRPTYQHWAVYVGDGIIVHLVQTSQVPGSDATSLSLLAEKAKVKKTKLSDVVGKDKWEINNSLDEKYEPRPADVIVRDAEGKVGEEMKYNLILWNCEHFATEMRYGEAESRQVRKVGEAIVTILHGIESLISCSKEENN